MRLLSEYFRMSSDDTFIRTLLAIIAGIVLVPLLMMAFMMPMMGIWGWGHMWNGGALDGTGATWMWLAGWLVMLAIVAGVGYLLYGAVRRPSDRSVDPALEELRTAYARGELSDEEFEWRRRRLETRGES